jgi:16S rRNA C967 or C1407 C5-methylase (RsmB/RsmF family)/transcription termination factor NusB
MIGGGLLRLPVMIVGKSTKWTRMNKESNSTLKPRLYCLYYCFAMTMMAKDHKQAHHYALDQLKQRFKGSITAFSAQEQGFIDLVIQKMLRRFFLYIPWIRSFFDKPMKKNRYILELLLLLSSIEYFDLKKPLNIVASNAQKITHNLHFKDMVRFIQAIINNMAKNKPPQTFQSSDFTPALIKNAPLLRLFEARFGKNFCCHVINEIINEPALDLWFFDQQHPLLTSCNNSATATSTTPTKKNEALYQAQFAPHHRRFDHQDIERIKSLYSIQNMSCFFNQQQVFAQDIAAAIPLLLCADDIKDQNILDLCAAPGGKTLQALALGAKYVNAVDSDPLRIQKFMQNIKRLHMVSEKTIMDQNDIMDYQPATLYPFVVLDAPCSASGTFRKNPDILWHKKLDPQMIPPSSASASAHSSPTISSSCGSDHAEHLKTLHQTQKMLLHKAATFVKPGGHLLYIVCSVMPEEGVDILSDLPDGFSIDPFSLSDQKKQGFQKKDHQIRWQDIAKPIITDRGYLLSHPQKKPGCPSMDGFFAVKLKRKE